MWPPIWPPPGTSGADAGRESVRGGGIDLSYQDLTAGQQRLFVSLGRHPGTEIDAYAAAALDGTSLNHARWNLAGLYDHHLITEPDVDATGSTT